MTTNTLEALEQVVTLALDHGLDATTIAVATRHGCAGELAAFLCTHGYTDLATKVLDGMEGRHDHA